MSIYDSVTSTVPEKHLGFNILVAYTRGSTLDRDMMAWANTCYSLGGKQLIVTTSWMAQEPLWTKNLLVYCFVTFIVCMWSQIIVMLLCTCDHKFLSTCHYRFLNICYHILCTCHRILRTCDYMSSHILVTCHHILLCTCDYVSPHINVYMSSHIIVYKML